MMHFLVVFLSLCSVGLCSQKYGLPGELKADPGVAKYEKGQNQDFNDYEKEAKKGQFRTYNLYY